MTPCLIDFARQTVPLDVGDDLAKAIHVLRSGGWAALPVVVDGKVLGILREVDAARALGPEPAGAAEDGSRSTLCVGDALAVGPDPRASPAEPIAAAWERMLASDLPILAVVDPGGSLIGVASRGEVIAGLRGDTRPAVVGGLATPLGVYLTTLDFRSGAGDLGLVLSGAFLMALDLAAVYGTHALAGAFPPLGAGAPEAPGLSDLGLLLTLLAFFALLRVTPLAGTHGAEHQVVHAIEKGEPLVTDRVTAQPREHPRCGTNLAAAVLAAQVALPRVVESPALAGLAVVLLFFGWRKLGWVLQRVFTTGRPRPRQLEDALRAARDLLAQYSRRPVYRAPGWRRVWNTGMVQILVGALVVLLASRWVM